MLGESGGRTACKVRNLMPTDSRCVHQMLLILTSKSKCNIYMFQLMKIHHFVIMGTFNLSGKMRLWN